MKLNSFSSRTIERFKHLHYKVSLWTAIFIATCPIDCFLNEGIRTAEDQNKYYKQGNSKLDGYIKKGKHQDDSSTPEIDSRAVDIYYVGWKSSDSEKDERWDILYKHALEVDRITGIKMTHGYNWGWDKPHHELT